MTCLLLLVGCSTWVDSRDAGPFAAFLMNANWGGCWTVNKVEPKWLNEGHQIFTGKHMHASDPLDEVSFDLSPTVRPDI
jgi:hypothetical protein